MNPILTITDASVRLDEKRILKDISVDIEGGEFFVVIGPNGSGKTTLLKVVAGLIQPEKGSVAVQGRPVSSFSKKKLAQLLAYVPQHVPFDFPFTVFETVLMGRFPHLGLVRLESSEDRSIAHEAMRFTDVEHLADRRLDQLSGGELQRVVIARAICQQSQIILLDEPTASLDPAHQIKVMDLLKRLRVERQTTILMVSHDLNLAALYGQRLLLLKEGHIQHCGTPEEVCTRHVLEECYGCSIAVDRSPAGNSPRMTLLSQYSRPQ